MKRILIVEDDEVISLINQRMIEKLGYEAYCSVSNGLDAIEKCKKTKPDIILMDIQLEGLMDGIQAMNEIRKFTNAPVIFLSANNDPVTYDRAVNISRSLFLAKPVELIQLQTALGYSFK